MFEPRIFENNEPCQDEINYYASGLKHDGWSKTPKKITVKKTRTTPVFKTKTGFIHR
jgi:hypothetical protein